VYLIRFRVYAWSLFIAIALTAIAAVVSGIPGCSAVGVVFFPGMVIASLVFREGVHSNNGDAYLLLAGFLSSVLFAFPVMWLWKLIESRRRVCKPGDRVCKL
jgi:hypothetical protein